MSAKLQSSRLQDIAAPAAGGKVAPIDCIRGTKTHRFEFEVTADVSIAGAGGGNVLAEGLSRCISLLRLLENGVPRVEVTGPFLAYLTSRAQYLGASVDALASAGAQANTILRGLYVLDFAELLGADPGETCYSELDSRFPVQLEFTFAASYQSALISGTGLTMNSLGVKSVQHYDKQSKLPPVLLPRVRRQTSPAIVGSQGSFRIDCFPEAGRRLMETVCHALSDGATSATIFTGDIKVRDDQTIYHDTVPFRVLLNRSRRFHPGVTPSAGYMPVLYREYGKLSECYVSGQGDNLRWEAAVTQVGTTAVIDVYSIEGESVPNFTRDLPEGW